MECDHYRRLDEDLDVLVSLGVTAYRFSTAWPRVLPRGQGPINPKGLAFYDRLVDGLHRRGIEPWLTLYHWDLPQALQDKGGRTARESVSWFGEYVSVMVEHFGDRVRNWTTINEPWVSSFLGYHEGVFAPGLTDWSAAISAAHHHLLAHGTAVPIIRRGAPGASVGIALDCRPAHPVSSSREDLDATRHFDGFRNRWFFDPVFAKGYPDDLVASYKAGDRWPPDLVHERDMAVIAEPLDFCGVNYYTSLGIDESSRETERSEGPVGAPATEGFTEMG